MFSGSRLENKMGDTGFFREHRLKLWQLFVSRSEASEGLK